MVKPIPKASSGGAMSDPRAFVSFDFDNNETQKILFAGQAKTDSPTPFTVHDWSSKTKLPQSQWEALVKRKMASTNMCIVLVGRSMNTATGVAKEIAMAKELNVPTFGVYVDGANTSSTLPAGLQQNRTMAWKWDTIARAVTQMMGEGKNA
ncbi:TIR domain-containing protein [Streptomyces sp. NBC_00459]|uniref:TIR domain-containing protein n=1 Tax=Streptomyces sp. NBC_00459 TaxID=2975749 RepID=UPI002E191BD4